MDGRRGPAADLACLSGSRDSAGFCCRTAAGVSALSAGGPHRPASALEGADGVTGPDVSAGDRSACYVRDFRGIACGESGRESGKGSSGISESHSAGSAARAGTVEIAPESDFLRNSGRSQSALRSDRFRSAAADTWDPVCFAESHLPDHRSDPELFHSSRRPRHSRQLSWT